MTPSLLFILGLLPPAARATQLLASHYSGDLYTLTLSDNGSLAISASTPSGANTPSWITFDPDSRAAYIADESFTGAGTMPSFAVADDGTLTPTGEVPTEGGDVHSCLFGGDDGRGFIATVNYEGSSISTYALPLTPASAPLQTLSFTMDAPGPVPDRQNKPHPHSALVDPSGAALLVPDLGADLIRIFAIDAATGALSDCPPAQTGPGDGPRHGAFATPGGDDDGDDGAVRLYTVNELGNSLTAWDWAAAGADGCPSLAALNTLSTYGPDGAPPTGSKAAEVRVRDGFAYATNRADETFGPGRDSLAVFSLTDGAAAGGLAWEQLADARAFYPRTLAVNAAGDRIAVGGQTSANVAVLERDAATGRVGALVASVDVGAEGTAGAEDGLSAVVWL